MITRCGKPSRLENKYDSGEYLQLLLHELYYSLNILCFEVLIFDALETTGHELTKMTRMEAGSAGLGFHIDMLGEDVPQGCSAGGRSIFPHFSGSPGFFLQPQGVMATDAHLEVVPGLRPTTGQDAVCHPLNGSFLDRTHAQRLNTFSRARMKGNGPVRQDKAHEYQPA